MNIKDHNSKQVAKCFVLLFIVVAGLAIITGTLLYGAWLVADTILDGGGLSAVVELIWYGRDGGL